MRRPNLHFPASPPQRSDRSAWFAGFGVLGRHVMKHYIVVSVMVIKGGYEGYLAISRPLSLPSLGHSLSPTCPGSAIFLGPFDRCFPIPKPSAL